MIVAISNRGVTGVPGVLWLQLASPDGQVKMRGTLDPGYPHGGGIRLASFLLPNQFEGSLNLSAELELRPGVLKPVTWSGEQPINEDGSIAIELIKKDDHRWRKGV